MDEILSEEKKEEVKVKHKSFDVIKKMLKAWGTAWDCEEASS